MEEWGEWENDSGCRVQGSLGYVRFKYGVGFGLGVQGVVLD